MNPFHCDQDERHLYKGMSFCIAEKTLLSIDAVTTVVLIAQITVYFARMPKTDFRLVILIVCLISSVYTFIHYGMMSALSRSKTFFVNEFFRFIILFTVCYYYCDKASGLLKNKKKIIIALKMWGIISVFLILLIGIFSIVKIQNGKIDYKLLCIYLEFESYRYYSIVTCLFFSLAIRSIRKNIIKEPRLTPTEHETYNK
jgi:hypothetical protein